MPTVLIIDNYDSFTYNLVQAIAALPGNPLVHVVRNDAATAQSLADYHPTHLVISPGPGTPADAGINWINPDRLSLPARYRSLIDPVDTLRYATS